MLKNNNQPKWKASLISVNKQTVSLKPDEQFEWNVNLRNEGNTIWRVGETYLQSQQYEAHKIQLEQDINPGKIGRFSYLFEASQNLIKDETQQFQLMNIENGEKKQFGPKITLTITVHVEQQKQQNQLEKQNKHGISIIEKTYQLMDMLMISEEQARSFVLQHSKMNVEQLINLFYDEN